MFLFLRQYVRTRQQERLSHPCLSLQSRLVSGYLQAYGQISIFTVNTGGAGECTVVHMLFEAPGVECDVPKVEGGVGIGEATGDKNELVFLFTCVENSLTPLRGLWPLFYSILCLYLFILFAPKPIAKQHLVCDIKQPVYTVLTVV